MLVQKSALHTCWADFEGGVCGLVQWSGCHLRGCWRRDGGLAWLRRGGLRRRWETVETLHVLPHLSNHGSQDGVLLL